MILVLIMCMSITYKTSDLKSCISSLKFSMLCGISILNIKTSVECFRRCNRVAAGMVYAVKKVPAARILTCHSGPREGEGCNLSRNCRVVG